VPKRLFDFFGTTVDVASVLCIIGAKDDWFFKQELIAAVAHGQLEPHLWRINVVSQQGSPKS